jgi:choline dehydrogenase-like flavoprotein
VSSYDVIVIGSGAGGGTLVHRLAPSGKRILVLERTLDRDGDVRLAYKQTNHEPAKRLYHKLKEMLAHCGMHPDHLVHRHAYLKTEIPIAGVAHQAGTCRCGRSSQTSVLDTDCRAHELDNLYVVDTSFFPSIGAVNPALTAMANALRVGDHPLERLGAATPANEPSHAG